MVAKNARIQEDRSPYPAVLAEAHLEVQALDAVLLGLGNVLPAKLTQPPGRALGRFEVEALRRLGSAPAHKLGEPDPESLTLLLPLLLLLLLPLLRARGSLDRRVALVVGDEDARGRVEALEEGRELVPLRRPDQVRLGDHDCVAELDLAKEEERGRTGEGGG